MAGDGAMREARFVDVARVISDPASVVPDPGYHDDHEMVLILDGTYHGVGGGVRFALEPGEGVIYPAGLRHGVRDHLLGQITMLVAQWRDGPELGGAFIFTDKGARVAHPLQRLFDLRNSADATVMAMRDRLLGAAVQEALWLAAGAGPASSDDPIERVRQHLEDSYCAPIDLKHLCAWWGMSRSSLCQRFTERFGCGPMHYLQEVRLRHARRLLGHTNLTAESIAERIGLRDRVALSRLLKARTGLSLRAFRKSLHDGGCRE